MPECPFPPVLPVRQRAEVINRVLLRVNDRIVTQYDYEVALGERQAAILRSGTDEAEQDRLLADAPLVVMRSLFDELLIVSRADQLGVTISEIDLEEAMRFQWEQSGIENEEQFRTALVQNGMTMSQYREMVSRQLLFQRVTGREVYPRVQVGDAELRDLYQDRTEDFLIPEQRRLVELVVLEGGEPSAANRDAIASELHARWLAGDDSEVIAEGQDPEVVQRIDIGWVSPGDLAPTLEAAAWQLEPGGVSGPITARGGLHLLRLLEVREASLRPFEEVRELLLRQERGRRLDEEMGVYLQELEEKAYFRSDLPPELAAFRTKSGRAVREDALQLFSPPPLSEDGSDR